MKMILITKEGAFEAIDLIPPLKAMSTGECTHIQKCEPEYVCKKILSFRTNCDSYRKMSWGLHRIIDVTYIEFSSLHRVPLSEVDFILNDKSELNKFIQKFKK